MWEMDPEERALMKKLKERVWNVYKEACDKRVPVVEMKRADIADFVDLLGRYVGDQKTIAEDEYRARLEWMDRVKVNRRVIFIDDSFIARFPTDQKALEAANNIVDILIKDTVSKKDADRVKEYRSEVHGQEA